MEQYPRTRALCRDDYERKFFDGLLTMVNCDYAKYHHTYWQAGHDALNNYMEMLLNREVRK
jgi:hypothetical protein